ncbi:unnamed protein product [Phytomonas sp. Hart1]|nr:unnamed protein product [Phytomonas sp. Hart1]|eukprot:CCW70311.1 unnamed protein product [Phytomonas sp. isolate Hart1]
MSSQLFEKRIVVLSNRYNAIGSSIQTLQEAMISLISPAWLDESKKVLNTPNTSENIQETQCGETHVDPSTIAALQPCKEDLPIVAELRRWCLDNKLCSAIFKWVPSDYYSHTLTWRRDILNAPSIAFLCKTIVLTNTHCVHSDFSVRENSRYYLLVVQYVERFDADLVMRFIRKFNPTIGKKKFNFRLASSEESLELTGFPSGAVVPYGTRQKIPIILSSSITKLEPRFFWTGGGHLHCKARIDLDNFLEVMNPMIAPITVPLTSDELENIID